MNPGKRDTVDVWPPESRGRKLWQNGRAGNVGVKEVEIEAAVMERDLNCAADIWPVRT